MSPERLNHSLELGFSYIIVLHLFDLKECHYSIFIMKKKYELTYLLAFYLIYQKELKINASFCCLDDDSKRNIMISSELVCPNSHCSHWIESQTNLSRTVIMLIRLGWQSRTRLKPICLLTYGIENSFQMRAQKQTPKWVCKYS